MPFSGDPYIGVDALELAGFDVVGRSKGTHAPWQGARSPRLCSARLDIPCADTISERAARAQRIQCGFAEVRAGSQRVSVRFLKCRETPPAAVVSVTTVGTRDRKPTVWTRHRFFYPGHHPHNPVDSAPRSEVEGTARVARFFGGGTIHDSVGAASHARFSHARRRCFLTCPTQEEPR